MPGRRQMVFERQWPGPTWLSPVESVNSIRRIPTGALHEEVVRLADNSLLWAMTRAVAGRDRWVFRMTSDRDPVVACREHHELCEAIYAGNEDFAASVSFAHIERGRRPTVDTLRSVLPAGGPTQPE